MTRARCNGSADDDFAVRQRSFNPGAITDRLSSTSLLGLLEVILIFVISASRQMELNR
jgi:hypothetical protein